MPCLRACGVAMQVGVMDLQFSGRVRITLTGLMNRVPVVSAAQASHP